MRSHHFVDQESNIFLFLAVLISKLHHINNFGPEVLCSRVIQKGVVFNYWEKFNKRSS